MNRIWNSGDKSEQYRQAGRHTLNHFYGSLYTKKKKKVFNLANKIMKNANTTKTATLMQMENHYFIYGAKWQQ